MNDFMGIAYCMPCMQYAESVECTAGVTAFVKAKCTPPVDATPAAIAVATIPAPAEVLKALAHPICACAPGDSEACSAAVRAQCTDDFMGTAFCEPCSKDGKSDECAGAVTNFVIDRCIDQIESLFEELDAEEESSEMSTEGDYYEYSSEGSEEAAEADAYVDVSIPSEETVEDDAYEYVYIPNSI
jgi:hypothetical protein